MYYITQNNLGIEPGLYFVQNENEEYTKFYGVPKSVCLYTDYKCINKILDYTDDKDIFNNTYLPALITCKEELNRAIGSIESLKVCTQEIRIMQEVHAMKEAILQWIETQMSQEEEKILKHIECEISKIERLYIVKEEMVHVKGYDIYNRGEQYFISLEAAKIYVSESVGELNYKEKTMPPIKYMSEEQKMTKKVKKEFAQLQKKTAKKMLENQMTIEALNPNTDFKAVWTIEEFKLK